MSDSTVPERIDVTIEDPRSPAAAALIAALSAELRTLYSGPLSSGTQYGDAANVGGAEIFAPETVQVPGGAFVIAWLEGQPVGCGALRPFDEPGEGEIERLYVVPGTRGRRIGERILEKLEELARAWGYLVLKLETGTLQPAAIRLYERTGYTRIPCYGAHADNDLSVCYMKSLSGSSA